jgi:hypothetical protein
MQERNAGRPGPTAKKGAQLPSRALFPPGAYQVNFSVYFVPTLPAW